MNLSMHHNRCFDAPQFLSNGPAKSRFISSLDPTSPVFLYVSRSQNDFQIPTVFKTLRAIFAVMINFSI